MKALVVGAGAVVVLAAAVLVYVFTSAPEQPDATPPPSRPAPTLKPLAYGSEALWSTPDGAWHVDVRDDAAVYEHDHQLVVADVATGSPRWRAGEFKPLPGNTGFRWKGLDARLVEHDSGLAVLTAYDRGDEQGLVLLSAADGRMLWHTPLRKPMSAEVFELRAVDDRVAVTTNRAGVTVAVEIRTGKQLWRRPGTDAKAIAGDVLLVQGTEPSAGPSGKLLSQVTALDLATGAVRWDLIDRYEGSEVLAGGEDTAQVRTADQGGRLLAAGDGRELAAADGEGRCATGDGLLACPGVDGVVVRDLATDAVTETGVAASGVDRVQDGRFYLTADDRWWTIDAVGNVLDEKLPGELTAITDAVVCFMSHDSFSVSCHQRNDR